MIHATMFYVIIVIALLCVWFAFLFGLIIGRWYELTMIRNRIDMKKLSLRSFWKERKSGKYENEIGSRLSRKGRVR